MGAVAVIVLSGASGYGGGLVSGSLQTVGRAGRRVPRRDPHRHRALRCCPGGAASTAQRLILIGIGLSAALSAVTSWLLVRARIQDAASAQVWLNGSLNARGWEHATPLLWTLAVLVPVSLLLVRHLNALQLGDDAARALGVRLQTTQLLVLVAAVGLVAVAVAAVGPLEFVAFVVPQIALRLTGGSRPPMLASMVFGACLVVGADLVTRVVLPFAVPAGLVTAAIGAPYLIWLLRPHQPEGLRMTTGISAPPRLEAADITVGYGGAPVVRDLDLAIPDGQVTTIVGPNGCGKSTLLRTLARLLTPVVGHGAARRRADHLDPHPRDRHPPRAAAPEPGRPGRAAGARPRRPRAAPAPALVPAVVARGRGDRRRRPRDDRHRRPAPTGRSTSSPAASGSAPGSR